MKLRWAICGAGKISNDFCSALQILPDTEHEIVAVAARSVERAKAFGEKFKIRKAYGSYEEVAKDEEVDIVYVGVIHTGHLPLTKQMLQAGKHVLCEKPMCFSLSQAKEIFKLAREKNRFFMEAVWSRAFPIYEKIRKEIQSGGIGEVQMVRVEFCIPIKDVERIKNVDLGGGTLLDIGMYTIQFINWIYNNERPQAIKAVGSLSPNGVDEDGCVIMSYKNGGKAVASYSGKCKGVNGAAVFGTKGNITIPHFFWCPSEAILPSGPIRNDLPEGTQPFVYDNGGGLRFQADLARKAIMAGEIECPVMSFADSEMMYTIIDEVRQQIGLEYDEAKWS